MRALLPVSALLVSVAILLTGNGLQSILLPVRAGLEGFSTVEIALISSCYFAGFAAGCKFGPRLVRKVGHIRSFTAMTAIASAIALLHAFLVLPAGWWLMRLVTGFCFAVLYMVIESWLNERSTQETRGVVLSAYMFISLTVVTLGQMLLPTADPAGMGLFALVSMLVSLAAVPVALTGSLAPAPIESTKVHVGALYGLSPAGVTASLVAGLAVGPFWALSPQFAAARGLDDAGVAFFMSAAVLGGALGQWPFGRLSDRVDRRLVIALAAALAAIAAALLTFLAAASHLALFTLAAIWGACAFPIYSLGVAHTNDRAEPGKFVETSSGLLLVYGAGAVVGPVLASFAMDTFGTGALFAFGAVVYVLLAGFVVVRRTRIAPAPAAEHVSFADVLQAVTTVSPVFDEQTQAVLEEAAAQPAAEAAAVDVDEAPAERR